MPNPFRSNYDYGEGGYNFIDKIKARNKKRKNNKVEDDMSEDITEELIELANHLDSIGLSKEADQLDYMIAKNSRV